MSALLTETNTPAVRRKVTELAAKRIRVHHHLTAAFEHGQWWILCNDCGAIWSVVDCEPGPLDAERVDDGDGSCEEA